MKILIKINNDKIVILNQKKADTKHRNMLNTNVINKDELVFSSDYIKENTKLMVTFFNDLIKNYQLSIMSFQNLEILFLLRDILPNIKGITQLIFDSEETISYKVCQEIIKCHEVKFISGQYIPAYIFEIFDKKNIIAESRSEILFVSNFMLQNNLNNYSSMFYKTSIYLELPLTENDTQDLETFCKINKRLKSIHVVNLSKQSLKELIKILKENNKKNIKIIIYKDNYENELIDYLKKHNKLFKKRNKITFKLKYSKEFINANIASQTNNNILRMICYMIILIIIGVIITTSYQSYKATLSVNKIQKSINEHINTVNQIDLQNKIKEIENNDNKYVKNKVIAALQMKNPNTVGWLKLNNTNIDYPVVQYTDNDFYLNHNFNNEKEDSGWVFLDYENSLDKLDDNNIIYAHNYYYNGIMFGTLNSVLKKSWINNPENLIISYDTLYNSYKFKIFSVYIIPITDDYIQPSYEKNEEKTEFFRKIIKRSIYNFNMGLTDEDKILTLQTCQNETSRLVVHAVLINDNN